jgi:hypothetical protein
MSFFNNAGHPKDVPNTITVA